MELEDKNLICKICGAEFILTAGEQQFYIDRVLAEPRRCPKCRPSGRMREMIANNQFITGYLERETNKIVVGEEGRGGL